MDVDFMFFKNFRIKIQRPSMSPNVGMGRLHRLLHHIAKLSGQCQCLLTGHQARLNMKHFTTHRCPGKAVDNTYLIFVQIFLANIFFSAQIAMQSLCGHLNSALVPFRHFSSHLAAHFADFPFQITQTGFTSVFGDNFTDCFIIKTNVLCFKTVFLNLTRNQIALGNLQLFLLGVTGQINNLHPVAQG